MGKRLNILMMTHHRRHRAFARSHAMASQLVQRGHQVSLMVISEHRRINIVESEWDGVRVIETPDLLWGRLRSGWDIWNLINRIIFLGRDGTAYDFIHCFETRPATIYPALYGSKQHHIPLFTDWNDWYGRGGLIEVNRPYWYRVLFGSMETYYEEAFRASGLGVTVISSALRKRACKLGIPPEHICQIPGGAFPELFQDRTKEECRRHAGISPIDPVLGFSSMDSHLDIEFIFLALAELTKRYPSIKMIITGQYRKSILALAQRYNVHKNIILTGFLPREELPWYLGCADLFVLPFPGSNYNLGRWPNKICDYMCLGRPTVSNPFGDIKTLFEQYAIGLLADYDPYDFSEKVGVLLERPERSRHMGRVARRVAVNQFSWGALTNILEDFYYARLR